MLRARVPRVRIQPDLAEEIFWNDLAISRQLRTRCIGWQRARKADIVWLANDWTTSAPFFGVVIPARNPKICVCACAEF